MPEQESFQAVDLPHDWMIYDTCNLYRDSIGWYHKRFFITELTGDEEYSVRFDGVYMDSTVWVNGQQVMEWKYGYSAFEAELTPFLQKGENHIWVRAVYRSPNTRWYSGAGIYRNVRFVERKRSHILTDGIYVTPVKEEGSCWRVEADTELFLDDGRGEAYFLKQSLKDPEGCILGEASAALQQSEAGRLTVSQRIEGIGNPLLWDIGQGNLYTFYTELWQGERLLETETQKIGFRSMEFVPEKGFLLNGRKVKLNGVCEHHDFGCLGAAFSLPSLKRKFLKLREMGVNAVRTSHNMPPMELMELADEMGFLILSEAFDMWEKPKTTYDYARFFNEWYEKDVTSWVRRDRNHPSLLMWSIGNEIQDTMIEGRGAEITANLKRAVRAQDYKNHAPVTIGSNFMKWENPKKCAELLDCVGYNYAEFLYEEHHRTYPHWVIYGSETSSIVASRGIYHFPREKTVLTDEDEQCSALGNSITSWSARSVADCIGADRDAAFSMGQFLWSGFDYIGESTPYETKNCYFGQIDTAGFPKDSFYLFQAEWTDYKKKPMVHLFPYWDFNEGQRVDVQVCSNAPETELFVNGRSLGRHRIEHQAGREQIGLWKVPYEKGEITAVAYDEAGRELVRKTRRSFGEPVRIEARAERREISGDGIDAALVEITAYDAQGNPVENAKNRIFAEVEGAGRLLGLDNGNSTDFDQHKGKSRRLFGGKLLAVIASRQEAGEIRVTFSSEGLTGCEIVLTAKKVPLPVGISAREENSLRRLYGEGSGKLPLPEGVDLPLRKISLSVEGEWEKTKEGRVLLTREKKRVRIKACLFPQNTAYPELEWRAMNDTGIDVNFVDISPCEGGVEITATGDGDFRLRCFARNGGSCVSVQSSMEMRAEGIGRMLQNPYREIPAGLCDYREEGAGEGAEHGIQFPGSEAGEEECIVGFTGLDFGDFGSDTISLPIFANTSDPITFRLFRGHPKEEGSELVADCVYQKPSKWMVFQEQSYRLKRRMKGNDSLYIATRDGFQLRGISFVKQEKAFSYLGAADCDRIYGDAYERLEKRIEKIGNNVTLEYRNMDFGTEGAGRITLCCRSFQELNPLQLRFTTERGTDIQVVEVQKSPEYGEQTFSIERLSGKGELALVFLPGSCFDLEGFVFQK